MDYVKRDRNMPWIKRGMRADMDGRSGVITAGAGGSLRMRFDGQKRSSVIHPKWQMTYYGKDGSVIADYKKQEARA